MSAPDPRTPAQIVKDERTLERRVKLARDILAKQDEGDHWMVAELTYQTVKTTPGPPQVGEVTHRMWAERIGISVSYSTKLRAVWVIGQKNPGISFTEALAQARAGTGRSSDFPEPSDPNIEIRRTIHRLKKLLANHPDWKNDASLVKELNRLIRDTFAWRKKAK